MNISATTRCPDQVHDQRYFNDSRIINVTNMKAWDTPFYYRTTKAERQQDRMSRYASRGRSGYSICDPTRRRTHQGPTETSSSQDTAKAYHTLADLS